MSEPRHFFLECDRRGQITWMSNSAHHRLGPAQNLLEALPPSLELEARRFLNDPEAPRNFAGSYRRPGQEDRIPVTLCRVLSVRTRVLLFVDVRERRSDHLPAEVELLLTIQKNAVRNHFRLLRAARFLESRSRTQPRFGSLLAELLELERTRISRELHAGAGQSLAGIRIHLELLQHHLGGARATVQSGLEKIGALAQDALDQTRAISHRLHPPAWQSMDLRSALQNLWRLSGVPEKFCAELHLGELQPEPAHSIRVVLYRAVQEALANIIRHSGATRVRLSLEQRLDRVHLAIEDNGKGFSPEILDYGKPGASSGIGLRAIREQVRAMDGEFSIASSPRGTTLVISLPLMRSDE